MSSARRPGSLGPGPVPEAVLRGLDLTVRRRLEGLVPGDQRTPAVGAGTELAQIRAYREGDDVRQIDWNATARTGEPQVRVHVAERSVTTWLVLDASASMAFGTADRLKLDVAEGAATAVGRLATRRGNRLGIVAFGENGQRVLRPRQGRAGQAPLARLLSGDPPRAQRPERTLAAALATVAGLAHSRSLVVVIADFRGERDWVAPLKQLAAKHGVLALEVRDPREQELPDVGQVVLTDPESGKQLRVDTRSRALRERFATAAAEEREEVARVLRHCRAGHAVLTTEGEWFRTLARFLGGPRRQA
jgi:uncharacterized protein (DUF58 family)